MTRFTPSVALLLPLLLAPGCRLLDSSGAWDTVELEAGTDDTDEDCDDADAQQRTWYIDHDADGHGSTDYTIVACTAPLGYTDDASDCDDLDPAAHPGATEVCDGTDTDCNGTVDDAVDGETWYRDRDGDGFGTPDETVEACDPPSGFVETDTDCDDTDPDIFPEPGGGCSQGASCLAILEAGDSAGDGTYTIDPDGQGVGVDPFDVRCDMITDGGGWTEIPYASDLYFGTHFTGGDAFTWVAQDFWLALSEEQIAAVQAVSSEGTQTYVARCIGVVHYYFGAGDTHNEAAGFRFLDGTETAYGTASYAPADIEVTRDGCAGNDGGTEEATVFEVQSVRVPLVNIKVTDAGNDGEYYGSQLIENPAWLR